MIRWYRIQNFYSFRESTTVSFELNGKAPRNDLSFDSPHGARLSRVMTVLGPNGSGKTQLLKPLPFLNWLICSSFAGPVDEDIPFQQHFFSEEDEPTEIETEFEAEGRLFRYLVILNKNCILEESLKERSTRSFKTLFRRHRLGHEPGDEEKFTLNNIDLPLRQARKVRANVTLVAWAHQHDDPLAGLIHKAFAKIQGNVNLHGKVDRLPLDIYHTAQFFHKNANLFQQAKETLTCLDLGISDLELVEMDVETQGEQDKAVVPFAVHMDSGGQTVRLPMFVESTGTKVAFHLLRVLLPVLNEGGIAVIDEMEGDLHPMMLDPILALFLDPETNPHNAQMIFSCHQSAVFQRLEKEQIMLVEKDQDLCSDAWRLDEVTGVRRDDNLMAKYYSGAYGAIPKL